MQLPNDHKLPIHHLAACFNNTSATYKYYWLLSILQSVEHGEVRIEKRRLFARMVANAWYTVNYFHISFGKQDRLQRAIETIQSAEQLSIDESRERIFNVLITSRNRETLSCLNYFNNQVPHWFLSPWLPARTQGQIYQASQAFDQDVPYALYADHIVINPLWQHYVAENARVLKDFCYWNLTFYLQARNPNIPDIPNKLIKPAKRNSLTAQRRQFWDVVLKDLGRVSCIYTGKELTIGNYAVEHFIPYSFVSHDLIWNLIPADPSFNSAKNDKLPPLTRYFDSYYELQREAVSIITRNQPRNKFLEDYLSIFPDLMSTDFIEQSFTKERLADRVQPLISIAANNGFQFMTDAWKPA